MLQAKDIADAVEVVLRTPGHVEVIIDHHRYSIYLNTYKLQIRIKLQVYTSNLLHIIIN